jgi:hypothetical protein
MVLRLIKTENLSFEGMAVVNYNFDMSQGHEPQKLGHC